MTHQDALEGELTPELPRPGNCWDPLHVTAQTYRACFPGQNDPPAGGVSGGE